MIKTIECPQNLTQDQQDEFWMNYVQTVAAKAEAIGEVPVGAIIVLDNKLIAEGWNQSITQNDPTAHAEVMALKKAGEVLNNYRLIDTTLYVSLEPCPMCAGAMVHARVKRIVFGAFDEKTGAAGSVFNLVDNPQLNHQLLTTSGVNQAACSQQISQFFQKRRAAHKRKKRNKQQDIDVNLN